MVYSLNKITQSNNFLKLSEKLKEIKAKSQIDFEMFLNKLDPDMVKKVKHKMHNSFNLIDTSNVIKNI